MKALYWFIAFLLISTSTFGRSIYKIEGNDVIINLEGIGVKSKILKVELWTPGVVKIVTGMNETFSNSQTLIGERSPLPIKFKASYAQNVIEITTTKLLINIEENGLVRLLSRDGKKLLIESFRSFEPSTVPGSFKVSQRFFLNKQEHIYGMGQEDKTTRYNLRGKSFDLTQSTAAIASPYVFSETGYALIWDNYSDTHFSDTPAGMQITSDIADEIQFFFIYGPDWTEIISEIREISGKVPLLPKWAYGFWLNPDLYPTEAALKTATDRYHQLGIPVETKTSVDYYFLKEEKEITMNEPTNDSKFLNAYAYSKLKEKYQEVKETTNDRRLCIPTHTNLPGVQKFGTFLVSGAISSCWETLTSQISAGITSTLSGQPYWSTAIGGTTPRKDCTLESKEELLVRWYQFAALTPVFRGSKDDKEIWSLGNESDPNFQAVAKAIKLRYQLLPYIYATASDVVFNNRSMMRSMLFDSLTNEPTHDIEKQYLLGKSLMVCPVTAPGLKELPIYLPTGDNWYDFYTGKMYTGNQKISLPVTIDNIPFFVKQGTILPFATLADSANSPIEIRIYPGADGSFTLYEDENDGNGYLNKLSTRILFDYSEKTKTLSIGAIEGSFAGMISERIFNVVVVSEQNGIGTNYAVTKQEVQYKGKKIKLKLL